MSVSHCGCAALRGERRVTGLGAGLTFAAPWAAKPCTRLRRRRLLVAVRRLLLAGQLHEGVHVARIGEDLVRLLGECGSVGACGRDHPYRRQVLR